jgi:heat shock protein HslJ
VTVSWSVGGNVSRIQIKRNGLIVLDFAQFSDSLHDCLNSEGTFTYRIEAADMSAQLAIQQASVTVGSAAPGIVGGWRVVSINGAGVIPGTEMTAIFGDSNNLSGSSGCNTFSATYQINGSSLSVGPLGATSQVCTAPPGIMEQEQLFRTVLGSATGFTVEGRQLSIRSARGQLTLESLAEPR